MSLNSFWLHYAMEYAIAETGYNLDGDLLAYAYCNPDEFKDVSLTIVGEESNVYVTEMDILKLAYGDVNEKALALLTKYHENLVKHSVDPNETINSSMHSGSSDYLYARDIYEFFENRGK